MVTIAEKTWWRIAVINRRDWQGEDENQGTKDGEIWQMMAFCQISPWSFLATNGDLNDMVERPDYLARLGVDALWLMPLYKSPMKDSGYNITDIRKSGAPYSTMADFQHWVNVAPAIRPSLWRLFFACIDCIKATRRGSARFAICGFNLDPKHDGAIPP